MVQDWDNIRQHPTNPEEETRNEPNDESSNEGSCEPCNCEACRKVCSRCASCCVKSSAKCCDKCVSCCKIIRRQGWKKWCLFMIVGVLIIIVIVNIALTLWIMKVMEFNHDGMGPLRIYSGGVELTGKAYILDDLIASSIKSRPNKELSIDSYQNFTIKIYDETGKTDTLFFMDDNTVSCKSKHLIIEDDDGNVLFSTSGDQIVMGSKELKVSGEEGIAFDHSVVTPQIESELGQPLRIESLTRSLNLRSAKSMIIESNAGDIQANTLKDIHFKSKNGTIRIDSRKIFMPNLLVVNPLKRPRRRLKYRSRVYQVCVCENGRIFLAKPEGHCTMYDTADMCERSTST